MSVLEVSPVRAIAAFVLSIVFVSHTIGIAQPNLTGFDAVKFVNTGNVLRISGYRLPSAVPLCSIR